VLAIALFQLAWALADADGDAALAAVEEGIALTRAGASDASLGTALSLAAPLLARQGNVSRALDALRESIVHSYEVVDRITMGGALTRGAVTFALVGSFEPVAVLDGAMRAKVTGTEILVTDPEAAEEADAIERSRATLGPGEYEVWRDRGARMSYDELFEYLINELDRLIALAHDA
jgi:hypothetical protein